MSRWDTLQTEPMGEEGKLWVDDPMVPGRWLFKPRRLQRDRRHGGFPRGDDWAEVLASGAAAAIGLPAALVLPASRAGQLGVISRDVTAGRRLVGGNELLFALDCTYPATKVGTVRGYSLDRTFAALDELQVGAPPCPGAPTQTAASVFAGYLILDAWIANQDRHHGNWGVLDDQTGADPPFLAPSFDHGSSLGFQLHDAVKAQKLTGGDVAAWAARGFCRPMDGRPRLVDLALVAVRTVGAPAGHWVDRLGQLSGDDESSLLEALPDGRMSQVSRRFAQALMTTNRRRLLDGP